MSRLTHRTALGCTYFVTTKAWQSHAIFQVSENADILIECLLRYREKGAYLLHEFVVMPDHVHLLLTPGVETSLEKAMQLIKGGSSHEIHVRCRKKSEIWQPGFHEQTIRDASDYRNKAEYIRMNPVYRHLVEKPEEWPHGSGSRRFNVDAAPHQFQGHASGAKALQGEPVMSELKFRPPKVSR
jgi:putative transposase